MSQPDMQIDAGDGAAVSSLMSLMSLLPCLVVSVR
jgi:hypothetical protein